MPAITINSDKVQSTNKQVFKTLQDALNDFVNNKKWTDATFAMNERIDCSMTLIINEMVSDNSFKGRDIRCRPAVRYIIPHIRLRC